MTTVVIGSPAGDVTVTVDPSLGGRITSFVVRGTETTCGPATGTDTFGFGIYPMVPFAGRVRDAVVSHDGTTARLRAEAGPHALHGTVHSCEWHVDERTPTYVTMSTDLTAPWPWRGSVSHTISVTERCVRMELTLEARDSQPAMLGWHPWFARPATLDLPFAVMLERGDDHLPTGRRTEPRTHGIDDCFAEPTGDPAVTVGVTRLVLRSDCTHWVAFDGAAHGVCVEPQSGAPNAVNDEPEVIPAGGSMRRWFEIHW